MPMIAMTDARTNPFGKVSARIDITLHMTTSGTVNAKLQKKKKKKIPDAATTRSTGTI